MTLVLRRVLVVEVVLVALTVVGAVVGAVCHEKDCEQVFAERSVSPRAGRARAEREIY